MTNRNPNLCELSDADLRAVTGGKLDDVFQPVENLQNADGSDRITDGITGNQHMLDLERDLSRA